MITAEVAVDEIELVGRRDDSAQTQPPSRDDHRPLRVAWFGHAGGRRADGLSTYSREVVTALAARGVQVRFFSHQFDGDVAPVTDNISLPAWRINALTIPRPRARAQIVGALESFRPDVVHCSWSFSLHDGYIGRAARGMGAATVATFHLPYGAPTSHRGRLLRALYRFHVRNLQHYDTCIALSAAQSALLTAAGYPAPRISVVHNAVDTAAIRPAYSSLKQELGARFVVAYMGRLDSEKRVLALITAFLDLSWPDDHVLVIVGGGSQEGRLRRLVAGKGNIHFFGMVTDLQRRLDVLRAADIYVLPSTVEGLALSLLEAMAAGCAVIATDAGDDGQALADAGICLPVHPLQPNLTNALAALHDDPEKRRDFARRARERAISAYDMTAHVDRLLDIYMRVTRPHIARA